MTKRDKAQATAPGTGFEVDTKTQRLIREAMDEVARGKLTLSDVLASLASDRLKPADFTPEVERVPEITEEQHQALKEIVEIYGVVQPDKPRALTRPELRMIVQERDLIKTIVDFLCKRKDISIRKTLANHLDARARANPDIDHERAPISKRGDLALKQAESVEGTGRKIQRSVSGGKPSLTSKALHDAWKAGRMSRKQYLALTTLPEYEREVDMAKVNKAVKDDPALLFLLAEVSNPTVPQTTIKVENDN